MPKLVFASIAIAILSAASPQAQEPPAPKPADEATPEEKSEKKSEKPPEAPRPATHKVAPGPFKIEVSLSGIFEPSGKAELALHPKAWSQFVVERAVEPGTEVNAGEPIIWFETEKIDEEIKDLQAGQELGRVNIELAVEDLRSFEASMPLDLASAQRAKTNAEVDLKHFLDVDRQLQEKSVRNSMEQSKFNLEYAAEELRQLEKMYKADELTEETEEIILTRTRREVDSARFSLEVNTTRGEHSLRVSIPRQKETHTENLERQSKNLERVRASHPLTLAKKRLDLEKLNQEALKSRQRLEKLLHDRELMPLKAPAAGIVYFGRFSRGKWVDAPVVTEQLRRGGSAPLHQVIITIVEPKALQVRVEVAEKDAGQLLPGVEGTVTATSYPQMRLKAKLERLSPVPLAPSSFDATIRIVSPEKPLGLSAAMACSILLVPYRMREALTVPPGVIFEDDDDESPHVFVSKADGTSEKRPIERGRQTEKLVEVLRGLSAGEEVLLQKPDLKQEGPRK